MVLSEVDIVSRLKVNLPHFIPCRKSNQAPTGSQQRCTDILLQTCLVQLYQALIKGSGACRAMMIKKGEYNSTSFWNRSNESLCLYFKVYCRGLPPTCSEIPCSVNCQLFRILIILNVLPISGINLFIISSNIHSKDSQKE